MNILNSILLQQPAAGADYSGILMIVAMVAIFYFFMIRPQQKKQKQLKQQRDAMKKGDRVVTNGGLHGKITSIEDDVVRMEIAPNVEVKLEKSCVFPVVEKTASAKAK